MSEQDENVLYERDAYDLSLQSYFWSIQRLDAVNNTIASLTGWITTLNFAIISWSGKLPALTFALNSCLFYSAIFLLLVTIVYAIIIKASDEKEIIRFRLYQRPLAMEFKKTVIRNAEAHLEEVKLLIQSKHTHLSLITWLFFIEMVLLTFGLFYKP